ncbi:hypothetical protein JIP1600_1470004 [Flavobacterium psychrophilum]|nr:hypothetical protein JIP1600_1470004 [Flavobacterium psychrophilum]
MASGWARWRAAILHNELIVQGVAYPSGLHYNGSLCNIALGVVFASFLALVFERWESSSLFFFQLTYNQY